MKNNTLREGQIVNNYGQEFIARNIIYVGINGMGEQVFNYRGECTDNPCNDNIRNTGYNGGTYSWRASDK